MLEAEMRGAVFFDLDGTLVDYEAFLREALDSIWTVLAPRVRFTQGLFVETCHRVHRADEAAQLAGRLTTTQLLDRRDRFRRVLEALGAPDPVLAAELGDLYERVRSERTRALPGAHETLRALRSRGDLWIAVVTEGSGEHQRHQLDRLGFTSFLDDIVVSREVALHKPDPALTSLALGRAGVAGTAAAFVGDRPCWDLVPAKALGMWTALLLSNRYAAELEAAPGCADAVVSDHVSLLSSLLEWAARLTAGVATR